MIITWVITVLILVLSLFFWFRYLYLKSLRTAEDRTYMVQRTGQLLFLVPLGLQAAFLFIYAVVEVYPLADKFSDLFNKWVLQDGEQEYPDLVSLKIICNGSMLAAISYLFYSQVMAVRDAVSALVLKVIFFALNFILLKATVQNIYLALDLYPSGKVWFHYQNSYLWFMSGLLILFFSMVKGKLGKKLYATRYPGLASRIILLYCLLALVLMIPRAIVLVAARL